MVEAMTPIRKDVWKSPEDASKWLKARVPWGSWDERVFDSYVVCLMPIFDLLDSNSTASRNMGYDPYLRPIILTRQARL